METYSEWLRRQSPERQMVSVAHMGVCGRHGELQRSAPRSDECELLAAEIRQYHKDFPT